MGSPNTMRFFWHHLALWSEATFGSSSFRGPIGPLKHLRKEVDEAIANPSDITEFADMLFLVFDATRRAGFSFDDLLDAAFRKLEINRARKWPPPTPDGVSEHDRSGEPAKPSTEESKATAGDPRFLALLNDMAALHIRKAADYGRGQDPLANIRASADIGVPAWQGAFLRLLDKVHRIKSYCLNGHLKNEGVEDSFQDLAAYALIALVLFRENEQLVAEMGDPH